MYLQLILLVSLTTHHSPLTPSSSCSMMRRSKGKPLPLPLPPPKPSSPQPPLIPWISPLQYLSPNPSTPPPQKPSTTTTTSSGRRRFLSPADTVRLINRQSDPQRALDVFNSASLHPSFSHTHSTFSSLLLKLARSGKFSAVDAVVSRLMPLHPAPFQESVFLRLMPFYSRSGLPHKILSSFLSILPLTRRKPSPKALAVALDLLLARSRRPDLARRLLLESETRFNLHPNACVYNIIIKHHCRRSPADLRSAFAVLELMRKSSSEEDGSSARPNVVTYSTLMGGLCREGRLKDAFELFEEMLERDRIVPDQLTYNVLIDGFCRQGRVDRARAVVGFMRRNGCEPNMFNYSTLMNGFCREGKVDEAREVLAEMRDAGLESDAVTYTALIGCLCRGGRVDEGLELVGEMREKGIRPDVVTYNVVIEGMCKDGRVGEAMGLLERLPFEGVKLNVASYRIVFNCLCGRGEMERAVGLLGLMLGRGFVPHFAASNQLLVGLCEVGRLADATLALCGLTEMGFCPEEATWSRVVELVCRERKVRKAFELLDNLIVLE